MQAINTYIQDEKLKILAHRTLWLGNDHAHYVKTWKNKSLNDLKGLIERGIEYIDTHEQYIIHQRKVGILEKDIVKIEKTMQSKKKKTKVL